MNIIYTHTSATATSLFRRRPRVTDRAGAVTLCGRYPNVCPLTTPSSAPETWWCARCNCVAFISARSS